MAASNLKTRLMEQVIQVEKATRLAMVERLGLGKNLLEPMLLLGRGSRTTFNEYASFEFSRKKQAFSACSMLILET
mgnify:CR=1 FL=1